MGPKRCEGGIIVIRVVGVILGVAASTVTALAVQKQCYAPVTPEPGVTGGGLPFVLEHEAADALDARWRAGPQPGRRRRLLLERARPARGARDQPDPQEPAAGRHRALDVINL